MFGYHPATRATPARRYDDDDDENNRRPTPTLRPHYAEESGTYWVDVLVNEAVAEAQLNQFARDLGLNRNYIGDRPEIFERVLFACSTDSVDDNRVAMMAQFDRAGPYRDHRPHRCICGQTTYEFHIATNRRLRNCVLIGSCCILKWQEDGAPNHYVTGGFVVEEEDTEFAMDDNADYQPSETESEEEEEEESEEMEE